MTPEFRGGAQALFGSEHPEVLLEGPAGTGKTLAWLWRLHGMAERHPSARFLICRKTRRSLTESALVTFERDVLPLDHASRGRVSRAGRQIYPYPNGSEIVVAGIDVPSKILSTEYDLIYVNEATELNEEDWETLSTRLRNGRLSFQQLGADCNPDRPTHWLNQRCLDGKTQRLLSRHPDNPRFFREGAWTEEGAAYLEKLRNLSGARRIRLFEGRWAASEGLVFEEFDAAIHLVDRFPVPRSWPRIWSIDFGYTNAFVWQNWALDPDGRAFRTRELYQTQGLVQDYAQAILRLTSRESPPEAVICDHDAEGRAVLERILGVKTLAAHKRIREGIESVKARLRVAGDGRPRMFFFRDALVQRDAELTQRRLPTSLEEEIDGYVWDLAKETPVKQNDHALDALRYLSCYLDHRDRLRPARSWSG